MLGTNHIIAFVATVEPRRAKEFYEKTLGLRLTEDQPFTLVFDAGGTMLRISRVQKLQPAPYTVLGWNVQDIRAAVSDLTKRGVTFERFPGIEQNKEGFWTAPDKTMVAWFRDPDGNMLSLTQFP